MATKPHWKPYGTNSVLGTRQTRIDGIAKASGAAKYASDINTPGTLHARVLTCNHGAAKITKLNLEPARAVPGVKAVYAFKKVDEECLWDGTLVAAVAAERPEQAADGLKAIEVEYEVLDHFVDDEDLESAIQAGLTKNRGDSITTEADVSKDKRAAALEKAFEDAAVVSEGYYGIHAISHMCMEPHGSHCEWNEDGGLAVNLSTQNVSGTAAQFAQGLGVDAAAVSVECQYVGGGFGSKFAADEWGIACAELAKQARRPVRLMLDRATELKVAGVRPSGFAKIRVAANEDGELVAWDSEHWGSDGYKGNTVRANTMPYVFTEIPNRHYKATGIITNCGPTRAWRAPNHPQACAMTDTALDDLAAKLGMDSLDLFMKNIDKTAEDSLKDVYREELQIAARLMDWKEKWHPHGKGNGGPLKRGLGVAIHTWAGRAGAAKCTVKVNGDGTVESYCGTQDLGTGTRTVIAMTLAESFGLPVSAINVNIGSNKYPVAGASGGSTTVGGVSGPHRRAAIKALDKLMELVSVRYEVDLEDLSFEGGHVVANGSVVCTWREACSLIGGMPLEVQGEGPTDDGLTDKGVGGVQMADVSVDTETGVVSINKMVAVQDCGLVVDPLTAESQVYGALTMGIAYALTEERIMDNATGRYINADMVNYKLPRIGDVGELVCEFYQPEDQYNRGVIGLGEPPVISTGAAISNAVANATGVRVPVLPLTPGRVLDALKGGQA